MPADDENSMKVLITSDYILDDYLISIGNDLERLGHNVIFGPRQNPPHKTRYEGEFWQRQIEDVDIILTTTRSLLPAETLKAAHRLRGIVFPTIGTEAVDIEVADDLGLAVAHGPTPENFESMAEATVMLILALLYDFEQTRRIAMEGLPRPRMPNARMLRGKTIGLVGLGRIARGVIERLRAFKCQFLAFDPFVEAASVEADVDLVSLTELLERSDIVSVHATLTSETRHLINDEGLARMKRSAFLVNTSRGGLVDEAALCRALSNGSIAGAAIDATEREPIPSNDPLRAAPNLLLTPHMVGHTREIFEAIPGVAKQNIERIANGTAPLYWRNPQCADAWQARLQRLHQRSHQPMSQSGGERQPRPE